MRFIASILLILASAASANAQAVSLVTNPTAQDEFKVIQARFLKEKKILDDMDQIIQSLIKRKNELGKDKAHR